MPMEAKITDYSKSLTYTGVNTIAQERHVMFNAKVTRPTVIFFKTSKNILVLIIDLLDDDIEDDLNCVKIIYEEFETYFDRGFDAW